jgi:hypothetical protein
LFLLFSFFYLIASSACLPINLNITSSDATMRSIQIQQTQLSATGTSLANLVSGNPIITPKETESTPDPFSFTPSAIITETPFFEPSETSTIEGVNYTIDERTLKSAKILIFEDMSASKHIRYAKEALDLGDYFYLDVGSATGWFKSQLLSAVEWDLIIAAAESRRVFGGEYFEYIDRRVESGASTIIEYWDWDVAVMGKQKSLLDRCGVNVQSDWFEPDLRVFYWLDNTNPIFNIPNKIPSQLRNAERLWEGDIGDLFEIKYKNGEPVGDAVLLAGTNISWKDDHGNLVSCLDGRVILQGFSSHEYSSQDMVPLWENYIYNTLKNHFRVSNKIIPTPMITSSMITTTIPTVNVTSAVTTPGSGFLLGHDCGGILEIRLVDTPIYQKDLFEHHAKGTYLILKIEINNLTNFPIPIWDQDYEVQGIVDGKERFYFTNKAATGYLYIEGASNLSQDIIEPFEKWQTELAFDIDKDGEDWVFIVSPGKEFDQQVCEGRISLIK